MKSNVTTLMSVVHVAAKAAKVTSRVLLTIMGLNLQRQVLTTSQVSVLPRLQLMVHTPLRLGRPADVETYKARNLARKAELTTITKTIKAVAEDDSYENIDEGLESFLFVNSDSGNY